MKLKSAAFSIALLSALGGAAFAQDKSKPAADLTPAVRAKDASTMSKVELAQLKTCKSLPYRTMLRNKMCKAFIAAHPGAIPAPT